MPSVTDAALLPAFVGLSKAREMVLTGDVYTLDQLPPDSIANLVAGPGELAAGRSRCSSASRHTRGP